MTPTNVFLMLAIPLGLMGVIALVLLSGSLRPSLRRRLEWLMIGLFYPGMTIYFGWRAAQQAIDADWLAAALSGALGCLLAWQGVVMVRKQARADWTRT